MKLWVAENVLSDMYGGIAVIHANNEKEAIDVLYRDSPLHCNILYNYPKCDCIHFGTKRLDRIWWKYHKPTKLPVEFKLIKDASAYTLSRGK